MGLLSTLTGTIALTALFSGAAIAHPDTPEEVAAHIAARDRLIGMSKRSSGLCAGSEAAASLRARAIARRTAKVQELRSKRGLENQAMHLRRRDSDDLTNWSGSTHESSSDFTLNTPFSELFTSNATCALVPETTIGPYWVAGELERTDITDGQSGVPIHLDVQFVDVSNCEAVSDLFIDLWHCNATGVYSGVAAEGQGGLDTTHGRGVQISDSDGVVEFDSVYPGHYQGRTTHIHVLATEGATTFDNGTFTGGTAKHIGQMFFDDDLTAEIETTSPYSTNTVDITLSTADGIAGGEATSEYDPYLNYVRLGDSLEDGLLMWITIAIDTSADYSDEATPAAHYYEDGGVAEESSNMGGGPGGPDGQGPPGNMTGSMVPPMTSSSAVDESSSTSTISSTVSQGAAPRLRILGW